MTEDAAPELTATEPAPPACLNCGAAVPGHFCGHCGQEAHTHRFTLGHFLHEIPHTILHVDKGLFYTIKEMTLRPGPALRGFLAGQRIRHFKPLAYVLLVAGLSAFLYVALHLHYPSGMANPDLGPAGRQMQEYVNEGIGKYFNWFTVGSLPLTALLTWGMLRRAQFNYAECLVINAYLVGTATLLTVPFYLPYYLVNGTAGMGQVSVYSALVLIAYQSWAYASLLVPTGLSVVRRYVRGLLTTVLGWLLLLLVVAVVVYALHWPTARESFREMKQHALQVRQAAAHP